MVPKVKNIASFIMLTSVIALAACSSGDTSANTHNISPVITSSASPTSTPSPTAVPSASSAPTSTPTAVTPIAAPSSDEISKQLKELLALAKKGQIPNVKFAAHTGLIDDVKKAWGKPDKEEAAGKGIYATYSKKNVVIGFNKGSRIFDVRSSVPELQKLTLKQIEKSLGNPVDIKLSGTDKVYIYKANNQFQLKFIIPKSTGKVDHISVCAPKDAVNNMAG